MLLVIYMELIRPTSLDTPTKIAWNPWWDPYFKVEAHLYAVSIFACSQPSTHAIHVISNIYACIRSIDDTHVIASL